VLNALEAIGHTDVLQTDCGTEVLDLLKVHDDVGLVLLDWNMPFMNGLDCLKAMKANPETAGIPVVMVTSDSTKSNVVEAIQCGAANYLIKPFTLDKFREVVTGILG
jgi:two-component system chemotaxis response regulator CheY